MSGVTTQGVTDFLLSHNFTLSAFELWHELIESGASAEDMETLEHFFTDEKRFPSEAVKQFQGKEDVSLQTLAFERDEKLSIQEYELRIVREDLEALKLHQAEEIAKGIVRQDLVDIDLSVPDDAHKTPDDHERRLLNCAIKAYLVARGYKLSALTLCEEVDQDLDEWPGGRQPPQEPLWSLYLSATGKGGGLDTATVQELERKNEELARQVEELSSALELEKQRHMEAQSTASRAATEARNLRYDLTEAVRDARRTNQELDELTLAAAKAKSKEAELQQGGAERGCVEAIAAEVAAEAPGVVNAQACSAGEGEAQGEGSQEEGGVHGASAARTRIVEEDMGAASAASVTPSAGAGAGGSSSSSDMWRKKEEALLRADREARGQEALVTVEVVAEALPKVVPNVLIQKRDELLPVFLAVIQQHPEPATRESLTHTLFNLIKKPDEAQRRTIMEGFIALAKATGERRTGEELLPQCWNQINHKYPERRVLVAEACGALAALVSPDLRGSLIFSILQQLFEDAAPMVRDAAAANLALLLPLLPDHNKYAAVEEGLRRLLADSHEPVVETALGKVVPAMAAWLVGSDLLCTSLLPTVMRTLAATLEECDLLDDFSHVIGSSPRSIDDATRDQVMITLRLLEAVMPHLHRLVLRQRRSVEQAAGLHGGDHGAEAEEGEEPAAEAKPGELGLLQAFSMEQEKVGVARWAVQEGLPELGRIACHLSPREVQLRRMLCHVARALCRALGEEFTAVALAPVLASQAHLYAMVCGGRHCSNLEETPTTPKSPQTPEFPDGEPEVLRNGWPVGAQPVPAQVVEVIAELEQEDTDDEAHARLLGGSLCVLPVLLAGILPCAGPQALGNFLHYLIHGVCLYIQDQHNDAESAGKEVQAVAMPEEMVEALAFAATFEDLQDKLLAVMGPLVVSQTRLVRACAAEMLRALAAKVDPERIAKQVMPRLITLAADGEAMVKLSAIAALGVVAKHSVEPTDAEKITAQFDSYLEDGNQALLLAVVRTITVAAPTSPAANFSEWASEKLYMLAKANSHSSLLQLGEAGLQRRRECAEALLEALQAMSAVEHLDAVSVFISPTLETLLKGDNLLDMQSREICQAMLRDRSPDLSTTQASSIPSHQIRSSGSPEVKKSAEADKDSKKEPPEKGRMARFGSRLQLFNKS
ncbi:hypothetical protein CYMTET_10663 [Cymbomonas tetramitiformis]|uniref:LisH domain-containing protein n=1 Tax=Cymbomonas tetramitiformis TaxID=36881 RepID=A0AAE0LDL8_9CHLO|nr:hypothetical protein CYMTET_10663 [Cymbomonas tetramitiformis]